MRTKRHAFRGTTSIRRMIYIRHTLPLAGCSNPAEQGCAVTGLPVLVYSSIIEIRQSGIGNQVKERQLFAILIPYTCSLIPYPCSEISSAKLSGRPSVVEVEGASSQRPSLLWQRSANLLLPDQRSSFVH